ncbi:hypothetical protein BaRGS_00018461 [Batillaria attramentaria]|uniref:Uncharacterized protein n=1 Tax=Batillaria attramentaria TaxID=370345 RepID=A0ABD0KTZ2_9CAEN
MEDAVIQKMKTNSSVNLKRLSKQYKPDKKTAMLLAPSLVARQTTTGRRLMDPLYFVKVSLLDPPRPCLWLALPGNYPPPFCVAAVTEGEDDTRTVAPLYENSQLRTVVAPELLQEA